MEATRAEAWWPARRLNGAMPALPVVFSARYRRSYERLPSALIASCDRVVQALASRGPTPGMRVKPLLPDKQYLEARISSGHRLIFRIAGGFLHLVDLVAHDGRHRPLQPRAGEAEMT